MCHFYPRELDENKSIDEQSEAQLHTEWPFDENCEDVEIVSCKSCYYPVTFLDCIIQKVTNRNKTIGLVVPVTHLFANTFVVNANSIEQWRTRVYCAHCGIFLTLPDVEMNQEFQFDHQYIFLYRNQTTQVAILLPWCVTKGKISEMFIQHRALNIVDNNDNE